MGAFVRLSDHRCERCGGYTPNRIITERGNGICGGCFHEHGPVVCDQHIEAMRNMPKPTPPPAYQIAKRAQPGFFSRLRLTVGRWLL
jgi:hypothetical protein